MKQPVITTIMLAASLAFTAPPAQAQNVKSGSNSSVRNSANQVSASGAMASGGSVVIMPSPATTQSSTIARVESAPSLGGLAVGGGHPCAWTPGSAQISIIGGGVGGAQMQVDEACMLAVMAAASGDGRLNNAALAMIAARDPSACKALRGQGLISSQSTCGERRRTTVSTSTQPTAVVTPLKVKCVMKDGRVTPKVTRKVMDQYSSAAILAACNG